MKHLGKQSKQPTSPNIKILDKVKNNNIATLYYCNIKTLQHNNIAT